VEGSRSGGEGARRLASVVTRADLDAAVDALLRADIGPAAIR